MGYKNPQAYRDYQRAYRRKRRKEDPAFRQCEREAVKKYADANPGIIKQRNATNYERQRAVFAGRRYGISPEEYLERVALPCEICGDHLGRGQAGQVLDHDHTTGELRGTLCHKCNKALGLFKDSPKMLKCAVRYLAKYAE